MEIMLFRRIHKLGEGAFHMANASKDSFLVRFFHTIQKALGEFLIDEGLDNL